jgi:hypothetical protein
MADTAPNETVQKPAAPVAAPPPAAPAPAAATAAAAPEAAGPPKIKVRKHRQRSCDEKNAKGKLCAGHLKRWYTYPKSVEALIGPHAEIYRCEFCHTLYRPDPGQLPHSYTVRY